MLDLSPFYRGNSPRPLTATDFAVVTGLPMRRAILTLRRLEAYRLVRRTEYQGRPIFSVRAAA